MRFTILSAAAALMLAASPVSAAVQGAGGAGFHVQHAVRIAAPPAKVWEMVLSPGRWWNSEHSWSKNAANMTIQPVAGGCWCERWPGGSAEHMRVVHITPVTMVRMRGGLGPLTGMGLDGVLTWTLVGTVDGGTDVTLDYIVSGYSPRGFDGLSKAVDGVLAEQVNRLQMFLQTGSPTATATR
jgi:uncharacterized protein YndB with AHSA1/START domain